MQYWCSVFEIICSETLFDMENCGRKLEISILKMGKDYFASNEHGKYVKR